MPEAQIQNPKGAFGYPGGTLTTGAQPNIQGARPGDVEMFRNASTVQVIPRGAAVIWSTLSTLFNEVAITTVIGSPLFAGVAITSAGLNTDRTSVTTAAGLGGIGTDHCLVQTAGVVYGALLSSAVTSGDIIVTVNSTVAGSTGGGYLGAAPATAAGSYGVAGIAGSSGTTGTTGYLTAAGPRGVVRIQRSVVGSISTA